VAPGLGRAELRSLADEKFADAGFPCSGRRFSNASDLAGNRVTVAARSETARYRQWDGSSARLMADAVGSTHGVLPWIRSFW
jgi:hypothetical protein